MQSYLFTNIVLAALFSSALYIILKYFELKKIDNLEGITFNYITASLFSFFINNNSGNEQYLSWQTTASVAAGMGILFIVVFLTTAITAQKSGLAVTSIAGKMSMVIPITAGVFLYNEKLTIIKICGIVLALGAVLLTSLGKKDKQQINYLLPVLLFIGSGIVDTSIKLSEHYIIKPANQHLFFSLLFGSAGIAGLVTLLIRYIGDKKTPSYYAIAGGIILGIVNYYSLVFLVNSLSSPGSESSLIFSIVNMLVVLFSSFAGRLLFKEKLTNFKIAGMTLAIVALYILIK